MSKNIKMKARRFAVAFAAWSALVMLIVWVLAQGGFYTSAAGQMMKWHMFFDMSFMGLIGGMIEAAVMSFAGVYLFVFVYNVLNSK